MLVSNFSRYLGIWSDIRVLSYGTLPCPRPNFIITYTVVVMTGWAVKLWKTRKWHTVLIYWPAIILPDFTLNTIRWVLERVTWHMYHLTLEKCTLTVFHVAAGCVHRPWYLRKAHWLNISPVILSVYIVFLYPGLSRVSFRYVIALEPLICQPLQALISHAVVIPYLRSWCQTQ